MKAAQIALAILTGTLIAAATVLFVADENVQGWLCLAFGLLGYLALLAMIVSDSAPRRLPPPRP